MKDAPSKPHEWVFDTNVLVSAFINRQGAPGRLLDAAYEGRVRLSYDRRMIEEYIAVLRRPKFGFEPATVGQFLAFLLLHGRGVEITGTHPYTLEDQDDQSFSEIAFTNNPPVIVTGNARDFRRAVPFGLIVLSPAGALARIEPSRPG
ncbi:MAG: putative toxin-antitoxin system toxin component, PIN family [Verrucomicrobiota bacterium]